jgi:hypothetical protein
MTPSSAPDINSHQTRSKARAECSAANDFSTLVNCFYTLANDFSMLIAKAVTESFTLSILADSF